MKRKSFILALILLAFFGLAAAQNFDVSSLLLKVSVESGDSLQRQVNVNARSNGEYRVSVEGLEGVSVSDSEFYLNKGETRKVQVIFDSAGLEPGVYAGSLRVSGSGEETSIPLIFEIESKDLFFDINLNIPPQYTDVEPGGKLIAQLKIFDLVSGGVEDGLVAARVNVEYLVMDLEGNVISSEEESVVVEGRTQISKTVSFPKNIKKGSYVFVAVARYASSVGTSSFIFNIKKEGSVIGSTGLGKEADFNFLAVVFAVLIFFLGLIIAFVYLLRNRDKMFASLRNYHDWEMRKHNEILKKQINDSSKKKGANIAKIRAQARRRVEKLREEQRKREREFARLRKLGDIRSMERKLREWQKEGYSTLSLQREIKSLKKSKKTLK